MRNCRGWLELESGWLSPCWKACLCWLWSITQSEYDKKALELKRLVADLSVEKQVLKDIASGNF